MGNERNKCPTYDEFMPYVMSALRALGGSGTNEEIQDSVIQEMGLSDKAVDETFGKDQSNALSNRLGWARAYLKKYGLVNNETRGIWTLTTKGLQEKGSINPKDIVSFVGKLTASSKKNPRKIQDEQPNVGFEDAELPEESRPWRARLLQILQNMDPYGFERLAQGLLRESGFMQVIVTKKSGDGGIDGTGRLRIGGIFSINVAFQCKRYKGSVSAGEIRDFRGSLSTSVEKGVFITTGTFTKAAKEEASSLGKQQIDLMEGDEFITKLAEYGIGVKEVKDYDIDDAFFSSI